MTEVAPPKATTARCSLPRLPVIKVSIVAAPINARLAMKIGAESLASAPRLTSGSAAWCGTISGFLSLDLTASLIRKKTRGKAIRAKGGAFGRLLKPSASISHRLNRRSGCCAEDSTQNCLEDVDFCEENAARTKMLLKELLSLKNSNFRDSKFFGIQVCIHSSVETKNFVRCRRPTNRIAPSWS